MNEEEYRVPSALVHRMATAIFGSLIGIGGYMVVWAVNDAAQHTRAEATATATDARISALEAQVRVGVLPIAQAKLLEIERRLQRVEDGVEEKRRGQ